MHGIMNVKRKNFLLSITNKMQRYTLFFIAVNSVRVSGGETAWNT
jgi:hypothetical protein